MFDRPYRTFIKMARFLRVLIEMLNDQTLDQRTVGIRSNLTCFLDSRKLRTGPILAVVIYFLSRAPSKI